MKLLLLINRVIGLVFDKFMMMFYIFDKFMKLIMLIILNGEDRIIFYILGIKV